MQLIYGGKTNQSIPRYNFPENFCLSANPKHFSNTEESLKYLDEVIISYVVKERPESKLLNDQKALMLMDVFTGQMIPQVIHHYTFFYKQSIFDPRPENCLSFSKKPPQKIV